MSPTKFEDQRRVALVTTTIHVPHNLEGLLANIAASNRTGQVSVVVVGDRKTPAEAGPFLHSLGERYRVPIAYLDTSTQARFLRQWPALDVTIRYNCIQRRNVGYLWAALEGADIIVSVDDDNFADQPDFLGQHLVVGREVEIPVVEDSSGWWNVCERLTCSPPRFFYHRGFPKSRQTFEPQCPKVERRTVRIAVNAGLWLQNPDVDATANIEEPLNVVSMKPIDGGDACALASGTWCPFNSQNTAFDIRTLPAMYLVVMLDFLRGYRVGRLDDIWMSYFFRAIGDQFGDFVAYGPPLVRQARNPHNFVKDLSEELGGYIVTEPLVGYLRAFRTSAATYLDAYGDLIAYLRDAAEMDSRIDDTVREYFRTILVGMGAWHDACSDVLSGRSSTDGTRRT